MKLPAVKSSDPLMKYFTPDLFLRFNSPDETVADVADEAWEAAVREYHDYLDGLSDRLPDPVRQLARLSLHDAELLDWEEMVQHSSDLGFEPVPGFAVFSLRQGDEILLLIYSTASPVRKYLPEDIWPFSGSEVHWLYDEVDLASELGGRFVHRVLLSDGVVLKIPFTAALIHRIPSRGGQAKDAIRRSG